jgi:hypothetical protein
MALSHAWAPQLNHVENCNLIAVWEERAPFYMYMKKSLLVLNCAPDQSRNPVMYVGILVELRFTTGEGELDSYR